MSLRIPRRMGRFSRVTRSTGKVSPRLVLAQRLAQVQNQREAAHFQANLLVPFWGVHDRPCFEGGGPVDKILVERDFRSKISAFCLGSSLGSRALSVSPWRRWLGSGMPGTTCDDNHDGLPAASRANPGLRYRLPRICPASAEGRSRLHARDATAARSLCLAVA